MQIGQKEGLYGTYIWYTEAWNRIKIFHCKTSFEDEGIRKHLDSVEFELSIQDLQLTKNIQCIRCSQRKLENFDHQTIESYTYCKDIILSILVNILIKLWYLFILIMTLFFWVTVFKCMHIAGHLITRYIFSTLVLFPAPN